MRSAIYEGTVAHRRTADPVTGSAHHFSYQIAMLYLDLDEIDEVVAMHRLWRAGPGPAAVRIDRHDLPGDRSRPAAEAIGDLAAAHLGHRLDGPVAVLLHPRTWGWLFNPITCAYCFDGDGQIAALVAEVTNTPWHETSTYAMGGPGSHDLAKTMHVSPFLPMDLTYRIRYDTPGRHLHLAIDVLRPAIASPRTTGDRATPPTSLGSQAPTGTEVVVLQTGLNLRRREVSGRNLGRLLWRYPLMTTRVSAAIYAQALRLRLGGAAFYRHPDAPTHRHRFTAAICPPHSTPPHSTPPHSTPPEECLP